MPFVILGALMILANFIGLGPTAEWNWKFTGDLWKFCVPFVLAALWWAWADFSGYYKRREMRAMDDKRKKRREDNMANLGIDLRNRRAKRPGR